MAVVDRIPGVRPIGSNPAQHIDEYVESGASEVVVQFVDATARDAFMQHTYAGVTVSRVFSLIPAVAATITTGGLTLLRNLPGVIAVTADHPTSIRLNTSLPAMGMGRMWMDHGFTGRGVKVGVLDTGIDADHPDMRGRVFANDFTVDATPFDGDGHGTHVAGIIGGDGTASGGVYKGVAPQCLIYAAKVISDAGNGNSSTLLAGLDWLVGQGVNIINISLGINNEVDNGTDPVSAACNAAVAAGIVVVVAAGNDGPATYTVNAPAAAADVITVGSATDNQTLAPSSSRGPTADGRVKPDIVAVGVSVTAARAAGSTLGPTVGTHYQTISGTSMASPHIAGLCALIRQARPTLTPPQVKRLLMQAAEPMPGFGPNDQGAGIIDINTVYFWLRQSMTLRVSTGLRAAWMCFAGLQSLMQYGVIDVYTGEQPASADDAPTGTRIARITQDGLTFYPKVAQGGLFLTTTTPGELVKGGSWVLKGIATGTAGWFRWKWNGIDPDTYSQAIPRIDGAIPADLLLQTVSITPSTEFSLQSFRIILPNA